jgi:peptidoglycan/LPS O-acetylase OafA/YrhL
MFRTTPTIRTALARHNGVGPGFDLLRLGLACAIFYGHAKWIAGSSVGPAVVTDALMQQGLAPDAAQAAAMDWSLTGSVKRVYHLAMVPMFFALSGFLVMGSAARLRSLKPFLAFRFLRIFPALTVEVVLSALVLGPLFTTVSLHQYVSDPLFLNYFGNILGIVHFDLPGVFIDNPATRTVNTNLWTLPSEFYCYLITAGLMFTGLLFRRSLFLAGMILATLGLLAASLSHGIGVTAGNIYGPIVVVYYFFVGCLIHQWQDRIPFGWGYFLAACVAAAAAMAVPRGVFVAPFFLAYATVFIGTLGLPRLPLIHRGDYSYGIYLYGFPICQALIAAFPALRGHENWLSLGAGLLTVAVAVLSWHLIEKPTLALKRHFGAKVIPQSPETRAERAESPARTTGEGARAEAGGLPAFGASPVRPA